MADEFKDIEGEFADSIIYKSILADLDYLDVSDDEENKKETTEENQNRMLFQLAQMRSDNIEVVTEAAREIIGLIQTNHVLAEEMTLDDQHEIIISMLHSENTEAYNTAWELIRYVTKYSEDATYILLNHGVMEEICKSLMCEFDTFSKMHAIYTLHHIAFYGSDISNHITKEVAIDKYGKKAPPIVVCIEMLNNQFPIQINEIGDSILDEGLECDDETFERTMKIRKGFLIFVSNALSVLSRSHNSVYAHDMCDAVMRCVLYPYKELQLLALTAASRAFICFPDNARTVFEEMSLASYLMNLARTKDNFSYQARIVNLLKAAVMAAAESAFEIIDHIMPEFHPLLDPEHISAVCGNEEEKSALSCGYISVITAFIGEVSAEYLRDEFIEGEVISGLLSYLNEGQFASKLEAGSALVNLVVRLSGDPRLVAFVRSRTSFLPSLVDLAENVTDPESLGTIINAMRIIVDTFAESDGVGEIGDLMEEAGAHNLISRIIDDGEPFEACINSKRIEATLGGEEET